MGSMVLAKGGMVLFAALQDGVPRTRCSNNPLSKHRQRGFRAFEGFETGLVA